MKLSSTAILQDRPGASENAHIPFPLARLYALLHVNLLFSDSYVKSFYSACGRGRDMEASVKLTLIATNFDL
jgi:hypothetical protein